MCCLLPYSHLLLGPSVYAELCHCALFTNVVAAAKRQLHLAWLQASVVAMPSCSKTTPIVTLLLPKTLLDLFSCVKRNS